MNKYQVYLNQIYEKEVTGETRYFVTLPDGRRTAKVSEYETWHDSWEKAHAHMITKAEYLVCNLEARLEAAKHGLAKIKALKQ